MSIGFRVMNRKRVVSAELVDRFRLIPTANISDVMNRMTAGGPRLRPYHSGGAMCGPALTVKTRPGDNLMVHMALTMIQPGDIIVIDAGGDLTNSLIGERMISKAMHRGAGGFVVNGAIRDLDWVSANSIPVFGAGVNHRGPYKSGPGEINVPVAIDGMVIEPGDLVIGDGDGLICIPIDEARELYEKAHAKHEEESSTFADLGKIDQAEEYKKLSASLKAMGCEFES